MAIKHANHNSDFPLHLACCQQQFHQIIEKLIALYTYPDAVQKQNDDGQYPLHMACRHSYYGEKFHMDPFHINDCNNPMHPHHVIVKLINMWSVALMNQTKGMTPLHEACYGGCPVVIQFLVQYAGILIVSVDTTMSPPSWMLTPLYSVARVMININAV
jgi:ankyrin repeat protein